MTVAVFLGVAALPLLFVTGGALDGNFDAFAGGLTWQAVSLTVIEEFMGVGISLGLLVWFRERRNQRGRLDAFLSDSSFAVYVLHAPVLIGLALLLSATGLPALARFVLVFALGLAIALALGVALRKVPLLRRVLS
jgi:surface polysaccharide O-acyltransferase-like enzyme